MCVCVHVGLNKPGDAELVTQLCAIQPSLSLSVITGFSMSYNHALLLLMLLAQAHGVKTRGEGPRGGECFAISIHGRVRGSIS